MRVPPSVIATADASGSSRQIQARRRSSPQRPSACRRRARRCAGRARRSCPRPTTTSDAATAITEMAKIWPSSRAVQARERDQQQVRGVEHDLDGQEDDQRAAAQHHAERADREEDRAQDDVPLDVRPVHGPPFDVDLARVRAEHDAADRGHEQDDRRHLEREQVVGEEEPADRAGEPNARRTCGRLKRKSPALRLTTTITSARIAPPASTAPTTCQDGPPDHGDSSLLSPRYGDHEQEHHHHRAAVDEHLARGCAGTGPRECCAGSAPGCRRAATGS